MYSGQHDPVQQNFFHLDVRVDIFLLPSDFTLPRGNSFHQRQIRLVWSETKQSTRLVSLETANG